EVEIERAADVAAEPSHEELRHPGPADDRDERQEHQQAPADIAPESTGERELHRAVLRSHLVAQPAEDDVVEHGAQRQRDEERGLMELPGQAEQGETDEDVPDIAGLTRESQAPSVGQPGVLTEVAIERRGGPWRRDHEEIAEDHQEPPP